MDCVLESKAIHCDMVFSQIIYLLVMFTDSISHAADPGKPKLKPRHNRGGQQAPHPGTMFPHPRELAEEIIHLDGYVETAWDVGVCHLRQVSHHLVLL